MLSRLVYEVLAGLSLCFVKLNTAWDMVVDLDASCCNIYLQGLNSLCALVLLVINETVVEACHI